MKKFIDIIREAYAGCLNEAPPHLSPDSILQNLHHRRQIERVYEFVLDGFTLNDAVHHVAAHYKIDPQFLRDLVIDDYKAIRHRSDTYGSAIGHPLVTALNPVIREALDPHC